MSPRNYEKVSKVPLHKDVINKVADQPNLWYAFTVITGISNIAKLFSYTPPTINNNPNKDK